MTAVLEQLALFDEADLLPEMMVRFVCLGRPDRYVPRSKVVLPAGRDAGSRDENRFGFHLIDHGPQMSSLTPCQYGRCGDCRDGKHRECKHRPGEWQHHPVPQPETYLMHRAPGSKPTHRNGGWSNVVDESTGECVPLLPMHGWRCSCECHDDPPKKPRRKR